MGFHLKDPLKTVRKPLGSYGSYQSQLIYQQRVQCASMLGSLSLYDNHLSIILSRENQSSKSVIGNAASTPPWDIHPGFETCPSYKAKQRILCPL